MKWRMHGLEVLVMSIYLTCGVGPTAVNLTKLQQAGACIRAQRLPFIVAGDWNMTVEQLDSTGWLEAVGGAPVQAAGVQATVTGGSRVIDFFVMSPVLKHLVLSSGPVLKCPLRPHVALFLELSCRPRMLLTRRLVTPRPIPQAAGPDREGCWAKCLASARAAHAVQDSVFPLSGSGAAVPEALLGTQLLLEQGGLATALGQRAWGLAVEYLSWSEAAEALLCKRAGIPDSECRDYAGRGTAPRTLVCPLVPRMAPSHFHGSPAPEAWHCAAARLREYKLLVIRQNGVQQRWSIQRFLVRSVPGQRAAAEAHSKVLSLDGFEHWASQVKLLPRLGPPAIHALTQTADLVSAFLQRLDSSSAVRSFSEWAAKAIQGGGGPAHRWTSSQSSLPPLAESACTSQGTIEGPIPMMQHRATAWKALWCKRAAEFPSCWRSLFPSGVRPCFSLPLLPHPLGSWTLPSALSGCRLGPALMLGAQACSSPSQRRPGCPCAC